MPTEMRTSPPLHRPGDVTTRPRGILKNPSFSGPSGQQESSADAVHTPLSTPLDPQEAKEITLQNTLQNAGHRRSSSAARRQSSARRHSSTASKGGDDETEKMRLKWDEANLFLAEQESGGRMKITEPKTPYQYGDPMHEDEEEDDVAIDPRYVNVDEMDMQKKKKQRENDIPGLDIGEAEDENAVAAIESDRIVSGGPMSRENSRDKHVSVSGDPEDGIKEQVGMPTKEEQEKHRQFEELRKKHYEMKNVKDLLAHPEEMDEDDDELSPRALPDRGVNGS